jgi:hypothetical protein
MHIILEPNSNTASKEQGKDQETVEILPVDSNGQSPSGAPANSPTSQNNLAIPPTSPNLAQGNNNNQKQIRAKKDKKKKNKRKKRENKRNNPRNPNK